MSGDPQAVPLLIAWLQKYPRDSYYAAGALARTGDERAIAPLRDLLHDPSFLDNPYGVEMALLNLGPRGLDVLRAGGPPARRDALFPPLATQVCRFLA